MAVEVPRSKTPEWYKNLPSQQAPSYQAPTYQRAPSEPSVDWYGRAQDKYKDLYSGGWSVTDPKTGKVYNYGN